jgi:spermidine/putrescine transport system substrate-binding protein
MKKLLSLALILMIGVVALAGCQQAATPAAPAEEKPAATQPEAEQKPAEKPAEAGSQVESGDLVLYSYEETVTDFFLDGFREQYPQVNLKTAVYGELDEAIAKLRGGYQADVLNACVDYIPILRKLDMLEPVDTSKIEYWPDVFPFFREMPEIQAGENQVWMVPVDAGLEGIMYRTDKIDPPPTSWNDLWNEEYAGHIVMQDYARNAIGIAALALGYEDPFNLTDEQLEAAKQKLIEQKPLLLTYFESDEEVQELFKSGDAWISFGWTADANVLSEEEGIPVEYISPKEGAFSWVCGYSILKGTDMPNAAHALINHYLDPELQYFEATDFEYFVANSKVLDMLEEEEKALVGLDKPEQLQEAHVEIIPDNYDKWLQVWEEVQAAQ